MRWHSLIETWDELLLFQQECYLTGCMQKHTALMHGGHTLFYILWHLGQTRNIHHTHTLNAVHRQDQGQLPASIFIIFILPDLLYPSWRQWSQPSPCDASTLHTHTHTCSCTLSSASMDNWDQLLQGASSLDPAPPVHPAAAAALAFLAECYSKKSSFPFSDSYPPSSLVPLCVFAPVVLSDW